MSGPPAAGPKPAGKPQVKGVQAVAKKPARAAAPALPVAVDAGIGPDAAKVWPWTGALGLALLALSGKLLRRRGQHMW